MEKSVSKLGRVPNPPAGESEAPSAPSIPRAPRSIRKGSSLQSLLDAEAIACLANNLRWAWPAFPRRHFCELAHQGLESLGIMDRGGHLAEVLRRCLPARYDQAIECILRSLTPPLRITEDAGLGVFFYLPHVCFVAKFGLDPEGNGGTDPFEISMRAQYALTRRFTAEFSMRPFLIQEPRRTIARLLQWTRDPDPHVRRLCSEGSRPRLPWACRIPEFVRDPSPTLPILESLKDDPELYVRRSVANHIGDIAKDHLGLALGLCERWLEGASAERRWLIRHALRHPAKQGVPRAQNIRKKAESSPSS